MIISNIYRTHSCGDLNKANQDQEVVLSGWLHNVRNHGGVFFADIRDHYGITQCLTEDVILSEQLHQLSLETVIKIHGKVVARAAEMVNGNIKTGEIEVIISKLEVLSKSDPLPFVINNEIKYSEEMKHKYRYLDLRRKSSHDIIMLRSEVLGHTRDIMRKKKFTEVQTPLITASSPEGAKDYLVPSRLHKGKFYALPQAPQQFKQLLMVSGFDRYYQIAPCFRDEDSRADRLPGEFYQLDLEMSFVTQEDVLHTGEAIMRELFEGFIHPRHLPSSTSQWPRFSYAKAMQDYGTDKPDLRNPLLVKDVSSAFASCEMQIFQKILQSGGKIRTIHVPYQLFRKDLPRSFFDNLQVWGRQNGMAGVAYVDGNRNGPIGKFITDDIFEQMNQVIGSIGEKDLLFFVAGSIDESIKNSGLLRNHLGSILELIDHEKFTFCWIVDFPMYELDKNGKIEFSHNPFSMPQGGMKALQEQDPLTILGQQYDLVCNGYEICSGAIRNHESETLYKAFEIAGYSREQVDANFSAMINAFKFGAPPHGGMAPGMDRIIMLLAGVPSVRDVVAFPLNQNAEDPMMQCPREVDPTVLKELGLKLTQS